MAKWVWVLIPVAVVAGIVLVVNSPEPSAAIFDVIWMLGVIALLAYISVSARRRTDRSAGGDEGRDDGDTPTGP